MDLINGKVPESLYYEMLKKFRETQKEDLTQSEENFINLLNSKKFPKKNVKIGDTTFKALPVS